MNGFQLSFFTEQNRRHGHQTVSDWLLDLAKSLGIQGATIFAAAEGVGHDGRFHSAHFFELADQPVEIIMVVNEEQSAQIFERLKQDGLTLFYVKTAVEFGVLGQ